MPRNCKNSSVAEDRLRRRATWRCSRLATKALHPNQGAPPSRRRGGGRRRNLSSSGKPRSHPGAGCFSRQISGGESGMTASTMPRGLGVDGRRLFRELTERKGPGERDLIRQSCVLADELAVIRRALVRRTSREHRAKLLVELLQ